MIAYFFLVESAWHDHPYIIQAVTFAAPTYTGIGLRGCIWANRVALERGVERTWRAVTAE